jgi:hypothetical protein
MLTRAFIALFGGLAIAAPATAGPPIVVQAQTTNPADPADKLICRSVLQTGTRFSERKCATKRQWEAQAEEARRAAHEVIDRPQIDTCRDSC